MERIVDRKKPVWLSTLSRKLQKPLWRFLVSEWRTFLAFLGLPRMLKVYQQVGSEQALAVPIKSGIGVLEWGMRMRPSAEVWRNHDWWNVIDYPGKFHGRSSMKFQAECMRRTLAGLNEINYRWIINYGSHGKLIEDLWFQFLAPIDFKVLAMKVHDRVMYVCIHW